MSRKKTRTSSSHHRPKERTKDGSNSQQQSIGLMESTWIILALIVVALAVGGAFLVNHWVKKGGENINTLSAENKHAESNVNNVSQKSIKIEVETMESIKAIFDREEPLHKKRQFHSNTLAYVTPWNSLGYDMAKKYSNKFTYVSPVWHQVRESVSGQYIVTGIQDIDQGWMKEVRKGNGFTTTKVTPRFVIEGLNYQPFYQLATGRAELSNFLGEIIKVCRTYEYDGIVLEVWPIYSRYIDRSVLRIFVRKVAEGLKKANLEMILVIPPMRYNSEHMPVSPFDKQDFVVLKDSISFFSLMTYDFSLRPGPNAPIDWVREAIKILVKDSPVADRNKILVGLNFYGYDFSSNTEPIVGSRLSEIIHNDMFTPACNWHEGFQEMEIRYRDPSEIHEICP
eukprot:CFRG3586T1